jgi:lipoprotein NlpD
MTAFGCRMKIKRSRLARYGSAAWVTLAALALGACSSTPQRAPVEERPQAQGARTEVPVIGSGRSGSGQVATPAIAAKPLPGAENAGKAGYYTVKPGDTLIKIGLEHGQNWRDIVRWSSLTNPNQIEVGQVLRVSPPERTAATVAASSAKPPPRPVAVTSPVAVAQPVVDPGANGASAAGGQPGGASAATGAAPGSVAMASGANGAGPTGTVPNEAGPAAASSTGEATPPGGIIWAWPSGGPLLGGFDESKGLKGLSIGGNVGDPVLAAADGRVVYAGSGLRGYGNLVIVKHDATFLTAYAHNQALLVKEDQAVRRGQKIAEMGSSDADRVKLHFEVRRLGKPVDPATVLPAR